jgi:predicted dehydrogenase
VRIAVVGVGRMGRRHVQAVRSLGFEICGVCDTSQESLALAEKEQGVAPDRHFSSLKSLLGVARPDGVIIATTAPTHAEYTCLAAEAGVKAILCEKPMATSLADCDRMIEVCRTHGAKLAINHQMRFMEQYQVPKSVAEGEAFGGLKSVTVVAGS